MPQNSEKCGLQASRNIPVPGGVGWLQSSIQHQLIKCRSCLHMSVVVQLACMLFEEGICRSFDRKASLNRKVSGQYDDDQYYHYGSTTFKFKQSVSFLLFL